MEGRMSSVLRSIRRTRRRHRPANPPWWRTALPIGAVAGAVAAVVWAMVALVHAPFLSVREIEISGAERVAESEVQAMLQPILGRPLLTVSLPAVRSRLLVIPVIEDAIVARRLPDLLDVRILERTAVARVPLGESVLLVDGSGALFPPGAGWPDDDDLPVIRGVRTLPGAEALAAADRAGLRALEALHEVVGEHLPPGTVLDLARTDRIELRLGDGTPAVWLDRDRPQTNLAALFEWRSTVARLAPGRSVDLRFRNRLTVLPGRADTARR